MNGQHMRPTIIEIEDSLPETANAPGIAPQYMSVLSPESSISLPIRLSSTPAAAAAVPLTPTIEPTQFQHSSIDAVAAASTGTAAAPTNHFGFQQHPQMQYKHSMQQQQHLDQQVPLLDYETSGSAAATAASLTMPAFSPEMFTSKHMNCSNSTGTSIVEFYITAEQQRFLNELLPKGYSFQFTTKPNRAKPSLTKPVAPRLNDNQLIKAHSSGNLSRTPSQTSIPVNHQAQNQNHSKAPFNSFAPLPLRAPSSVQSDSMMMMTHGLPVLEHHTQSMYPSLGNPQQQQYMMNQSSMSLTPMQSNQSMPGAKAKRKNPPAPPQKKGQNNNNQKGGSNNNNNKATIANNRKNQQPANLAMNRAPATKKQKGNNNNNNNNMNNNYGNQGMMNVGNSGMGIEESNQCMNVLNAVTRHKNAFPFLHPVDPIKQGCPDYFNVIRDPMDLSTVEYNLRSNEYQSPTQFAADVRKIWNNSYLYNSRESQIYHMTLEMDKFFEKKFKEMESRFGGTSSLPYVMKMLEQAIIETKNQGGKAAMSMIAHQQHQASLGGKAGGGSSRQRGNANNSQHNYHNNQQQQPYYHQQQGPPAPPPPPQLKKAKSAPSKMDTPMTMQEKKLLGQSIMQLPPEDLRGVWDIVKSDANHQQGDQILQFDIDQISTRKARELEQYVKHKLQLLAKKQNKKNGKNAEKDAEHERHANQMNIMPENNAIHNNNNPHQYASGPQENQLRGSIVGGQNNGQPPNMMMMQNDQQQYGMQMTHQQQQLQQQQQQMPRMMSNQQQQQQQPQQMYQMQQQQLHQPQQDNNLQYQNRQIPLGSNSSPNRHPHHQQHHQHQHHSHSQQQQQQQQQRDDSDSSFISGDSESQNY